MKKRLNGKMIITLQSNLCVASGYSFAGIVDSDICYDDCGLPYIPAKRLKGCIRETLEQLLYAKYPGAAGLLCGIPGDKTPGAFSIGNAYLTDYETLHESLMQLKKDPERRHLYGSRQVLEQFTHVLGQTEIEDGIAKDNSLRYTRVVNRTGPLDQKNLVFHADLSCEDREDVREMLRDAIRGTRHIGLKRNRGFGGVKCTCEWDGKAERSGAEPQNLFSVVSENGKTTIFYRLKNTAPLMLSRKREDESENYISGSAVRGALAARFLAVNGDESAGSEAFRTLFLDGTGTVFSNLYPCDGDEAGIPAPEYINRLKKTKKIVNTIGADWLKKTEKRGTDHPYNPEGGNQPKKLKGKFVSVTGNSIRVVEPEKDIVYHHSHHKKNAEGKDGILYGMDVLRAGQIFAGQITVPDQYADRIRELILQEDFYFGKSRSAQYGRCVSVKAAPPDIPRQTFRAGGHLVVTFLSDAIFLNENGAYSANADEAVSAVSRALGIADAQDEAYLSMLQSTEVTGYSAVWNLRKPAVPAIRAGSCMVFRLEADFTPERYFIGERNNEGFGQIRLDIAEDMKYEMEEKQPEPATDKVTVSAALKPLLEQILVRAWLDQQKCESLTGNRIRVSNTALGRITLMLRESLDENRGDASAALDEFAKRIDSIKSEGTREEAAKVLSGIAKKEGGRWNWRFGAIDSGNELIREMRHIRMTDDEIAEKLHALWGDYLMTILVESKYLGGDSE